VSALELEISMSNSHAAHAIPPAKEKDDGTGLIRLDFGQAISPLTWLAAGLGLLLVALSMMGPAELEVSRIYANVLMASGIAIILAAFGGQATVRGKGFVFAGVCGIAAGLLGYLHYVDGGRDGYVEGQIEGLPLADYAVNMTLDEVAHKKHSDTRFEFVAFQKELDQIDDATLKILSKRLNLSFAIPGACLRKALDERKVLRWKFDSARNEITENKVDGAVIATIPTTQSIFGAACRTTAWSGSDGADLKPAVGWGPGLLSPAYADEGLPEGEIENLLGELGSGDPNVRLDASGRLSRISPAQVSYVLERLRAWIDQGGDIGQIKVGVVIAIIEMLRRNGGAAKKIALSDASYGLLQSFARSGEEPLRSYAGELLAML
jgi:chorismate mutase